MGRARLGSDAHQDQIRTGDAAKTVGGGAQGARSLGWVGAQLQMGSLVRTVGRMAAHTVSPAKLEAALALVRKGDAEAA